MNRACVIGAGTMGAGIAAHLANLGIQVHLLDLTKESAQAGLDRAKAMKPAHFYDAESVARITLGGIDTDLHCVEQVDWVCEAIVEKLDLKRALYAKLVQVLPDSTMVSTNTSGLELGLLMEGLPASFRKRFIGTHFFNPPRYLKLLELIPTEETSPEIIANMTQLLEEKVARRVVLAKDTPGFIANRYGMWAMFHAIHTTEKLHLSIEQADAITGPFLGRPRSASFRLNDLVGLDIMVDIAENLATRCILDTRMSNFETPKSVEFLLGKGWIGQKAGQGYYRREGKELLAFDMNTHAYRQLQEASFDSINSVMKKPLGERIGAVLESKDEAGEFLREHLIPVLQYATEIKQEISHSVQDFDRVMMWGFGWEMGPFAMIDAIGSEKLGLAGQKYYHGAEMMGFDGVAVQQISEPEYRTIHDYPVLSQKEGFNIRDLGEGVVAISLTSKMGVISPSMLSPMTKFLNMHQGPIVLTGEQRSFSAGFNLNFFIEQVEKQDWEAVDFALMELQNLSVLISQKPLVSAVYGHCLGAGFELASSAQVLLATPEIQIGLPEAKVGLIPGGAGTCRMRLRYQTSSTDLVDGCLKVGAGIVATSAAQAKTFRLMRKDDVICHHADRLITDARSIAKTLIVNQQPTWLDVQGPIVGMVDRQQELAEKAGSATQHDSNICYRVKHVFTKPTTFEESLVKERQEFIELLKNSLTQARIRHMIETGKPLKN